MGNRSFPATALGGRLYLDASAQGQLDDKRLPLQDETVVDMLANSAGHQKVRTVEELEDVVRVSERGLPAIRLWIHERLLHIARGM